MAMYSFMFLFIFVTLVYSGIIALKHMNIEQKIQQRQIYVLPKKVQAKA